MYRLKLYIFLRFYFHVFISCETVNKLFGVWDIPATLTDILDLGNAEFISLDSDLVT